MSNTINSNILVMNKGVGNPYHDKLGKFTTGPGAGGGSAAGSRGTNDDGGRGSWASSQESPLGKASKFKNKELAQTVERQIDGYERISVNCTSNMGYSKKPYEKNIAYFDNMAKRHNSELAKAIADGGKTYYGNMSDFSKAASYTSGHIRDVYNLKASGKDKEAKTEAKKVIDKYKSDIKRLTPYLKNDSGLTKVNIMMMKDCIQSVKDAVSL